MTKEEAAIIMAYTGYALLCGEDWGIFHEYIQKLMKRPVFTHELADKKTVDKIKELAKPDFIEICKNLKEGE